MAQRQKTKAVKKKPSTTEGNPAKGAGSSQVRDLDGRKAADVAHGGEQGVKPGCGKRGHKVRGPRILDGHENEEKVGYCNPPKKTRWVKGQSGNPAGTKAKPRKTPDAQLRDALAPFLGILARILTEEHEVPVKGRVQKMTLLEGGLRSTAAQFMNANLKTKMEMVKAFLRPEIIKAILPYLSSSEVVDEDDDPFSEEDRQLLKIALRPSKETSNKINPTRVDLLLLTLTMSDRCPFSGKSDVSRLMDDAYEQRRDVL